MGTREKGGRTLPGSEGSYSRGEGEGGLSGLVDCFLRRLDVGRKERRSFSGHGLWDWGWVVGV